MCLAALWENVDSVSAYEVLMSVLGYYEIFDSTGLTQRKTIV
jgi:hypothetical protein